MSKYFVRADLKLLNDGLTLMSLGILFQSLALFILNDLSKMLWDFAVLVLDKGGILQQGPRRAESINSNWRSFGEEP